MRYFNWAAIALVSTITLFAPARAAQPAGYYVQSFGGDIVFDLGGMDTKFLVGSFVDSVATSADGQTLTIWFKKTDDTIETLTFSGRLTDAQVQALVGAMFTGNAESGGVMGTYDSTTGKINLSSTAKGLPEHNQVQTLTLKSRAGTAFWEAANEVPDGLGEQSGIGALLRLYNTDDQGYRWEHLRDTDILNLAKENRVDADRAKFLGVSATDKNVITLLDAPTGGGGGVDQTARDAASAADAQANANAEKIALIESGFVNAGSTIADLQRKAADLDIVSDGPGWAQAQASDAGIAVFASTSTIGAGLVSGNRALQQADVVSYGSWAQTITLGAAEQAVVVRLATPLSPLDFSLQEGSVNHIFHSSDRAIGNLDWNYYYLGEYSNATLAIDRRSETTTHTRFVGELAGRALAPITIADGKAVDAQTAADAAKAVADRAEGKADQALLDADIVIEPGPPFIEGVETARNLNISLRHPINAFPQADILSVSVQGEAAVLVAYDNAHLQQTLAAGIPATAMRNIFGSSARQRKVAGDYVSVTLRIQRGNALFPSGHAQAGQTNPDAIFFVRNIEVPVEAAVATGSGITLDQAANGLTGTIVSRPITVANTDQYTLAANENEFQVFVSTTGSKAGEYTAIIPLVNLTTTAKIIWFDTHNTGAGPSGGNQIGVSVRRTTVDGRIVSVALPSGGGRQPPAGTAIARVYGRSIDIIISN